jgi:hypothetical protein
VNDRASASGIAKEIANPTVRPIIKTKAGRVEERPL